MEAYRYCSRDSADRLMRRGFAIASSSHSVKGVSELGNRIISCRYADGKAVWGSRTVTINCDEPKISFLVGPKCAGCRRSLYTSRRRDTEQWLIRSILHSSTTI